MSDLIRCVTLEEEGREGERKIISIYSFSKYLLSVYEVLEIQQG